MREKLNHRIQVGAVSMSALVFALATSGCVRNHQAGVEEVVGTDCFSCHRADYESTGSPHHPGSMPTTCDDCHSTDGWRPALKGGHPEEAFPISKGGHQGIGCQDCHEADSGSSSNGENTNCIACHPDADITPLHDPVGDYVFEADRKNFCLTCHPSGEAARHPESKFPISRGDHRVECGSCHDVRISPVPSENVNCIGSGCHTRGEADRDHEDAGGYAWRGDDPDFCRSCHPRGTE